MSKQERLNRFLSFDADTGHVLLATVAGTVTRRLDWGIMRTTTKARLSFRMDTFGSAGYRPLRRYLGQPVNPFCEPSRGKDCVRVAARRYNPTTGYVNAIGPIDVAWSSAFPSSTFSSTWASIRSISSS